ncbi:hypothetical protein LROSL1_1160 [Furfurilactobacillus rossiae]|uniref:hypothetical protein n=1 Tax=Furfurilactobacillus rossiae TaxID=231049 RepID=UPI0015B8C06F|nr:hypothetical protein [Furfurilactobacillus rossiae]QLE63977.1 hypothetical protein LROSL1_1160 [Furfurilactobacillus rossiae]
MKNSPSRLKLVIGILMTIILLINIISDLGTFYVSVQDALIIVGLKNVFLILATIVVLVYWNRTAKVASSFALGFSILESLWLILIHSTASVFYFSLIFIVLTLIALLVDIHASRQQK